MGCGTAGPLGRVIRMRSNEQTIENGDGRGVSPLLIWGTMAVAVVALGLGFHGALENLVVRWNQQEEYSHGYLIVAVSLYLLWQKRAELNAVTFQPSRWGAVLVVVSAAIALLGQLTALFLLIHYALVAMLLGLVLALTGWRGLRVVLVPILLLLFAIPLPYFIDSDLSGGLQLLSSSLGVAVIRFFDIPVYLEGNVIDLGVYKLQVVDACSGLRYLYPLMSFGFICAYIWRARFWKKVVLFLSTIPITIFMNSLRIGITGLLTDRIGIETAQGFMHDFEGWFIFMACVLILFVEMWLLAFIGKGDPRGWDMFELGGGSAPAKTSEGKPLRKLPRPFVVSALFIVAAALASISISERPEKIPPRASLATFPLKVNEWRGQPDRLAQPTVTKLKVTDYALTNYFAPSGEGINLYVAYYENQRKGASPHSPRVCIPGGGWQIASLSREELDLGGSSEPVLRFNRVIIQRGEERQLVYYWFQQRGRLMANEYLVKWYLLVDALAENRTDGALVRLTTPIGGLGSTAAEDRRLRRFARTVVPLLDDYIPR